MSKMRWVNTDFWSDAWVVDNLNPLDRYLFVYLFTNSHTNIAGVYELSLRIMSFETGIERDELLRMVQRLQPKVRYENGWVVLRNGIKNQNYTNPKIKKGIELALQTVPHELLQHVRWPSDFGSPKPEGSKQSELFDDLPRPIKTHEDLSHSNTDSDSNTDSNSNTELTHSAKPRGHNKKSVHGVEQSDPVTTLYYQAIKSLGLPILNHDTLRKKIADMKTEAPPDELGEYLEFMRDQFAGLTIEYKPHVSSALDIYAKRIQIVNNFKRAVAEQHQTRVWRPKAA